MSRIARLLSANEDISPLCVSKHTLLMDLLNILRGKTRKIRYEDGKLTASDSPPLFALSISELGALKDVALSTALLEPLLEPSKTTGG